MLQAHNYNNNKSAQVVRYTLDPGVAINIYVICTSIYKYIRRFPLSKPGVAYSDSSQVQKRVPTSRDCYNNETGPKPAEILNSRHKTHTHTNFFKYTVLIH